MKDLFPEMKDKVLDITDRQIYKMFYPLASNQQEKPLHAMMIKTIIDPIRNDNYGYLTDTNFNSVAYLRNYGRGFYLPGKNQQKQIKY